MRRLICVMAAAVALNGCAAPSLQEMRVSGPARSYVSAKAEADLSKCILFAWQDIRLAGEPNTATMQPGRDGGTTVTAHSNEYFADIKQGQGKTSVKYYRVGDTWISDRLTPAIQSCL